MDSKVKAEIRKLRQKWFPRWVIIDDGTKSSKERRFWNGQGLGRGTTGCDALRRQGCRSERIDSDPFHRLASPLIVQKPLSGFCHQSNLGSRRAFPASGIGQAGACFPCNFLSHNVPDRLQCSRSYGVPPYRGCIMSSSMPDTYFAPAARDAPGEFARKAWIIDQFPLLTEALDAVPVMTMIPQRQPPDRGGKLSGLPSPRCHRRRRYSAAPRRSRGLYSCEGRSGRGVARVNTASLAEPSMPSWRARNRMPPLQRNAGFWSRRPFGAAPLDLKVTATTESHRGGAVHRRRSGRHQPAEATRRSPENLLSRSAEHSRVRFQLRRTLVP